MRNEFREFCDFVMGFLPLSHHGVAGGLILAAATGRHSPGGRHDGTGATVRGRLPAVSVPNPAMAVGVHTGRHPVIAGAQPVDRTASLVRGFHQWGRLAIRTSCERSPIGSKILS
jgi:hypothetical protein